MTQSAKEFFQSLKENPELGKQFDAELKKIAEEKSAQSDGEAIVKAARAMGYDFAEADMEKAFVSMQELDPEEMEKAAGGQFCWSDYDCFTILIALPSCITIALTIFITSVSGLTPVSSSILARKGEPYKWTSFSFYEKARTERK